MNSLVDPQLARAFASVEENKDTAFSANAYLIGERLDIRTLERPDALAHHPLVLELPSRGVVALFRYGAVVFFNAVPEEETRYVQSLVPLTKQPLGQPRIEEEMLRVRSKPGERPEIRAMTLNTLTLERLQVAADILAKNVVLEHYEAQVADNFDKIEPLAERLKTHGKSGWQARGLLRHIGDILIREHRMVGRVEVIDKPEVLWENPQLEHFYAVLENEFEIRERHLALERKLQLLSRTAETVLELVQNMHTLRVEWYIVILIVIEVLLSLYELFIK